MKLNQITTESKIKALGCLYKAMVQSINCGRGGDEFAVCGDIDIEDMEQLLSFARSIASEGDKPMQKIINGLRGLLENEVHTQAGL